MTTIQRIQEILRVEPDGIWGKESQAALDALTKSDAIHSVRASSFADPDDVVQFKKWFKIFKDRGMSDKEATKKAFAYGDNGIGYWEDDVTGDSPACALPPDDMIARWGSIDGAKHKPVLVAANDKEVTCILKDRMPWKKNITNGAGIDLNNAACMALDLQPPVMTSATWKWV